MPTPVPKGIPLGGLESGDTFWNLLCYLAVTRNSCSVRNVQVRIGGCSFLSFAIAPTNVGRVQGAKEEKCEPWPTKASHFSGETCLLGSAWALSYAAGACFPPPQSGV